MPAPKNALTVSTTDRFAESGFWMTRISTKEGWVAGQVVIRNGSEMEASAPPLAGLTKQNTADLAALMAAAFSAAAQILKGND